MVHQYGMAIWYGVLYGAIYVIVWLWYNIWCGIVYDAIYAMVHGMYGMVKMVW